MSDFAIELCKATKSLSIALFLSNTACFGKNALALPGFVCYIKQAYVIHYPQTDPNSPIPAVLPWRGGRLFSMLETILTVLEVLASLALIGVVLVQSGKEAGLSGAIAGNSDSYMSKNAKGGADHLLASSTKWIAAVWLLLTLALSLV